MRVDHGHFGEVAAHPVDDDRVAVAEIRAVAPAAHEQHRDAVLGAVFVYGVDAAVIGIHGAGQHAGLHAHGLERPVHHETLDLLQRLGAVRRIDPGDADEFSRVIRDDGGDVLVGHVTHEGVGLTARHDTQRHAAFLHFLEHQLHVALFGGRRGNHAELAAPAGDAFLIAEDVHIQKTARGGTEPEINDHDISPGPCGPVGAVRPQRALT